MDAARDSFNIKTSFFEAIKHLSDDSLGKIFKALFICSIHGEDSVDLPQELMIPFGFFKQEMGTKSTKIEPTFVYIIKMYNEFESFVKIGISASPNNRYLDYERVGYNVSEIYTSQYPTRIDAFCTESQLHEKLSQYRYTPRIDFAGKYECFDLCVLHTLRDEGNTTNKKSTKKKEKENDNEKDNVPTLEEFILYSKTLSPYKPELDFALTAKYNQWVESKWKDGNGNKIKNWKTKLQNTITYLKPTYTNTMPDNSKSAAYKKFEPNKP